MLDSTILFPNMSSLILWKTHTYLIFEIFVQEKTLSTNLAEQFILKFPKFYPIKLDFFSMFVKNIFW